MRAKHGHKWQTTTYHNEDGTEEEVVDEFAYSVGNCNGMICVNCGFSFCVHCTNEFTLLPCEEP